MSRSPCYEHFVHSFCLFVCTGQRIKKAKNAQGSADDKLTPKQLNQKLKKEASKAAKQAEKEAKKEEAARKKAAASITKKVIHMATKLSAPVVSCVHKSALILEKLDADGHDADEGVVALKEKVTKLDLFRQKCTSALTFYSKNACCELQPLPMETEKEVTDLIKEINKDGTDLKKQFKAK